MTLKLTNSQIKSTNPTLFGWVVCLVCYQPFASVALDNYLNYDNGFFWGHWLNAYPIAYMTWAAAIVVLIFLYTMASVSLGFRFSNLTYRGLASSGVYRLTKPSRLHLQEPVVVVDIDSVCLNRRRFPGSQTLLAASGGKCPLLPARADRGRITCRTIRNMSNMRTG